MPFVFMLLVTLLVGFVVGALTFMPRRKEQEDTPTPDPPKPTAPLALPYTAHQPGEALAGSSSPAKTGSVTQTAGHPDSRHHDDELNDELTNDFLLKLNELANGAVHEIDDDHNGPPADPDIDHLLSDLDEEDEDEDDDGFSIDDLLKTCAEQEQEALGRARRLREEEPTPYNTKPKTIPLLEELAEGMDDRFSEISEPDEILGDTAIMAAATRLAQEESIPTPQLFQQVNSGKLPTTLLALAALVVRADPEVFDNFDCLVPLTSGLTHPQHAVRFLTLEMASRAAGSSPRTRGILARLDAKSTSPSSISFLETWLRRRMELEGEGFICLTAEELVGDSPHQATLAAILAKLPRDLAEKLAPDPRSLPLSLEQREALRGIGNLVLPASEAGESPPPPPHLIRHELIDHAIKTSLQHLIRPASRPVLLVGEQGMGNSTTLSLLTHELSALDYAVFEASATEMMADQKFVGQVEGRIRELVDALSVRRVIWVIDRFHEFSSAGKTEKSDTSLLDLLLPYLRSGDIRVIAKTSGAGLQAMSSANPRLTSLFKIVRLRSPEASKVPAIVQQWAANHPGNASLKPEFSPAVIEEAHQLVAQFFPSRHAPGNVIELLEHAWEQQLSEPLPPADEPSPVPRPIAVTEKALLATLSTTTGMPLELLDPRAGLDVPALEAHFARHILGQPEAVRVLVDRVVMLKAGLTDPSRPLGVFLFAGPTGTGKTQIAKTLTSYLFGSPDRMIRLDMSEFIHPNSLAKLLGHGNTYHTGPALIDHIQRQPFSLILLDEFEKANPDVWDLFLQVFDEGRLTSATGEVVDFRNTIIILTSNLGAAAARQVGLGFSSTPADSEPFRPESIHQSISHTFRPEFLNRLDRVVVFRPLDRPTMRRILVHDLDAILHRRGLRNRSWHFDWDESAIDFLLDRGFTRDLGARPLRRAIDEFVLAPLAASIVAGRAPATATTIRLAAGPSGDGLTVDFLTPPPPLPQVPPPPSPLAAPAPAEGQPPSPPSTLVATPPDHREEGDEPSHHHDRQADQ